MLRPPSASALLQLLLQLLHQALLQQLHQGLETVRVLARCLKLCKVRAIRLSCLSLPRLLPLPVLKKQLGWCWWWRRRRRRERRQCLRTLLMA
jgi:hypothetical protein